MRKTPQAPAGRSGATLKQQEEMHSDLHDREIGKHLDRDELAELCDPVHYRGEAGTRVDQVAGRLT